MQAAADPPHRPPDEQHRKRRQSGDQIGLVDACRVGQWIQCIGQKSDRVIADGDDGQALDGMLQAQLQIGARSIRFISAWFWAERSTSTRVRSRSPARLARSTMVFNRYSFDTTVRIAG